MLISLLLGIIAGIPVVDKTLEDGTKISKITAHLADKQVVTDSRNDTEFVVTEYGIADLWGKSNKERAKALIDIAHPDFRPELKEAMKEIFHHSYDE